MLYVEIVSRLNTIVNVGIIHVAVVVKQGFTIIKLNFVLNLNASDVSPVLFNDVNVQNLNLQIKEAWQRLRRGKWEINCT